MQNTLNQLGRRKIPFFFVIDFTLQDAYIQPLAQLESNIQFSLENFNYSTVVSPILNKNPQLIIRKPIAFETYQRAFNQVLQEMRDGNTYLLNLTFPTEIMLNTTLFDIFTVRNAKFKLYFKDQFAVFSPERFIKIVGNQIETYPMKGTIDADFPDAERTILQDVKEKAEHTMVVDLLRNDLSMVSKRVRLEKFRYIDKITAGNKQLLQVSSKITGVLENHWQERIGDILCTLLPAGSISGAPKRKTLEIIKRVENYDRGFFTGIFGYFSEGILDSAVMIRFIERIGDKLFYKSGGGITIDSNVQQEYTEMLAKVY